MNQLSRDLTAAPAPTSAGDASQLSADVRPAPRWGHALFILFVCALICAGVLIALFGRALVGVPLVACGLVMLAFESGVGEMVPPAAATHDLRPCTVCGSMVPASHATYDEIFGFVCHDCDIPKEAA